MKLLLIIPLVLVSFIVYGQKAFVVCDSVIEMKGQYAKLRGKEVNTGIEVPFEYVWRGMGKPVLLNCTFVIYDKPQGKRKYLTCKLKYYATSKR